MKKTLKMAIIIALAAGVASCNKTNNDIKLDAGGINVTNAVIGGASVILTTNQSLISTNNAIGVNSSNFMPLSGGQTTVNIGTLPVAATATAAAIPSVTYYNQTLSVTKDDNYSLFLTGTSPATLESVLIKETYHRIYADSVCGVRFINLSPGSGPVSVNVQGSPNGSEVASVAYKAYSSFIQHPAKAINSSYMFEFRDANTGALITTYTLTTPTLHNVTLCLRGLVSGSKGVILNKDY